MGGGPPFAFKVHDAEVWVRGPNWCGYRTHILEAPPGRTQNEFGCGCRIAQRTHYGTLTTVRGTDQRNSIENRSGLGPNECWEKNCILQRRSFDMALASFRSVFRGVTIYKTRSRGKDTLWASTSIKTGGAPAATGPAVSLGDHNDGCGVDGCDVWFPDHSVVSPSIQIPDDSTPIKIACVVYNAGHSDLGEKVGDVAEAIISAGADAVFPGAGEILDIAYGVTAGLLFPNCDGPVVLQGSVITGARIYELTNGQLNWVAGYGDMDHGYNSPAGCGANSLYHYTGDIECTAAGTPQKRPGPRAE
jgi:hypothetical protein